MHSSALAKPLSKPFHTIGGIIRLGDIPRFVRRQHHGEHNAAISFPMLRTIRHAYTMHPPVATCFVEYGFGHACFLELCP